LSRAIADALNALTLLDDLYGAVVDDGANVCSMATDTLRYHRLAAESRELARILVDHREDYLRMADTSSR
jgi:hypothetical protein